MKKVIRLTENDIHRIVKNSVKRILKENDYDSQMIYLNGNVCDDEGNSAVNLWFENNTIVVRWVDENGADCTSDLLEDDPSVIWDIISSIRQ